MAGKMKFNQVGGNSIAEFEATWKFGGYPSPNYSGHTKVELNTTSDEDPYDLLDRATQLAKRKVSRDMATEPGRIRIINIERIR